MHLSSYYISTAYIQMVAVSDVAYQAQKLRSQAKKPCDSTWILFHHMETSRLTWH